MKSLVVYDSVFGNTEKVARAIGDSLETTGDVEVKKAISVPTSELKNYDFIIVGSPTHGGRASQDMKKFLNDIPKDGLVGIKVAAFDTRTEVKNSGIGLRMITGVLGYAAGRIAKFLKKKGGRQILEPEGFLVNGREGPLIEGELERARNWTEGITQGVK